MTIRMTKLLSLLVAALLSVSLTAASWANDRVTLTDGTVVEGTIKQELDGYIWFEIRKGGIVNEVIYRASQIQKIERNVGAQADDTQQTQRRPERRDQPREAGTTGAPRAAVITLGGGSGKDMVGLYMTAESVRRVIPQLEEDGVEILVLRINSGGGALLEIQRLSDLIEEELKPKFRVVAWIDSAISAAAMTAHTVEEIYFMTTGAYGACTGFYGASGKAITDRVLEEALYLMERISDRGGYDHAIMRAMQIDVPLSASFDEHGRVTWYQDHSGDHIVNPGGRVLTFNSQTAKRFGFSKGTADNVDELAKAMGLTEVIWIGEQERGFGYPISRAEREILRFRDRVERDERNLNNYVDRFQTSLAVAQNRPREERGPFLNRAREALRQIGSMVRNNPNFALFVFGTDEDGFWEWYREQEEMIRRLG